MSTINQIKSIANRAIESLNNNNIPWMEKIDENLGIAFNASSRRPYNFLNTFMLRKPGAYLTITYIKQLNAQYGLEGENRISFAGVHPHTVYQQYPVYQRDDDGNEIRDDEHIDYFAGTFSKVWHLDELSNVPLEVINKINRIHRPTIGNHSLRNLTRGFINDSDAVESWVESDSSSCYDIDNRILHTRSMNDYATIDEFYSYLLHEIFHIIGIELGWYSESSQRIVARGECYNTVELACEIGTAMILSYFRRIFFPFDIENYSRKWAEAITADPTMYYKACMMAYKASKILLPDMFPEVLAESRPFCANCLHEVDDVDERGWCAECASHRINCHECNMGFDGRNAINHFGNVFCPSCNSYLFPRWGYGSYNHLHYGVSFHGDGVEMMGMEIECSPDTAEAPTHTTDLDKCYGELMYMSTRYDGHPLWHCTTDSSIGNSRGDGIECVTHPATLDWWMSHNAIEDFHSIAFNAGLISYDNKNESGRTYNGLHIHVNNAWVKELADRRMTEENKNAVGRAKLLAIMASLESERKEYKVKVNGQMVKVTGSTLGCFARREAGKWCNPTRFGANLSMVNVDGIRAQYNEFIAHAHYNNPQHHGRYYTLNLMNENTVEFRIFAGTTNAKTIKATLQFVHNIMEYAKTHNFIECATVCIRDIIDIKHYDELSNYATARRL